MRKIGFYSISLTWKYRIKQDRVEIDGVVDVYYLLFLLIPLSFFRILYFLFLVFLFLVCLPWSFMYNFANLIQVPMSIALENHLGRGLFDLEKLGCRTQLPSHLLHQKAEFVFSLL